MRLSHGIAVSKSNIYFILLYPSAGGLPQLRRNQFDELGIEHGIGWHDPDACIGPSAFHGIFFCDQNDVGIAGVER
jgi:hypothetical protein